jgi:hypothetical protein
LLKNGTSEKFIVNITTPNILARNYKFCMHPISAGCSFHVIFYSALLSLLYISYLILLSITIYLLFTSCCLNILCSNSGLCSVLYTAKPLLERMLKVIIYDVLIDLNMIIIIITAHLRVVWYSRVKGAVVYVFDY